MSGRLLVWRGLEEWLAEACEVTLDGPPLTNFMPAWRLAGVPADHVMAWVSVPDLGVRRSEQRYPRLAERVVSAA